MEHIKNSIKGACFGLAIGDALGVPVEFIDRSVLVQRPVTGMMGYGRHNQPPGTFSDDSSLSFCLAEAIVDGFSMASLASNIIRWRREAYWTATEEVFDIGITTARAIERLEKGITPELAGDFEESANGNGSLMRILPLLFHIRNDDLEKRFNLTKQVSSITHMHIRSVIACFYYLEFALKILQGNNKADAYRKTAKKVEDFLIAKGISDIEISLFYPLLKQEITNYPIEQIPSSGYVVHTLIAAM